MQQLIFLSDHYNQYPHFFPFSSFFCNITLSVASQLEPNFRYFMDPKMKCTKLCFYLIHFKTISLVFMHPMFLYLCLFFLILT